MNEKLKYTLMVAGMVLSWSIYYAVSKVVVGATGSPLLAGFLLRSAALVFLTVQLVLDGSFSRLFHQGKAVFILLLIGVFGFLLDLFANLGYQYGSLSTGTALLKTDVLMVNLATVILYHKRLYLSDWLGTGIMLFGVLLVLGVDFGGMELHPTWTSAGWSCIRPICSFCSRRPASASTPSSSRPRRRSTTRTRT